MLKQKVVEIGVKNIEIKTKTAQEVKDEIKIWFKNLKKFKKSLQKATKEDILKISN